MVCIRFYIRRVRDCLAEFPHNAGALLLMVPVSEDDIYIYIYRHMYTHIIVDPSAGAWLFA